MPFYCHFLKLHMQKLSYLFSHSEERLRLCPFHSSLCVCLCVYVGTGFWLHSHSARDVIKKNQWFGNWSFFYIIAFCILHSMCDYILIFFCVHPFYWDGYRRCRFYVHWNSYLLAKERIQILQFNLAVGFFWFFCLFVC